MSFTNRRPSYKMTSVLNFLCLHAARILSQEVVHLSLWKPASHRQDVALLSIVSSLLYLVLLTCVRISLYTSWHYHSVLNSCHCTAVSRLAYQLTSCISTPSFYMGIYMYNVEWSAIVLCYTQCVLSYNVYVSYIVYCVLFSVVTSAQDEVSSPALDAQPSSSSDSQQPNSLNRSILIHKYTINTQLPNLWIVKELKLYSARKNSRHLSFSYIQLCNKTTS